MPNWERAQVLIDDSGNLLAYRAGDPTPTVAIGAGGGANTYADLAIYEGNAVALNNGQENVRLTWDSLGEGVALLDIANPAIPTVVTAGIYAVTARVRCDALMTADGAFESTLFLDGTGLSANSAMMSQVQPVPAVLPAVSLACTFFVPAGGTIELFCSNWDGVAARNFRLQAATVQRLS